MSKLCKDCGHSDVCAFVPYGRDADAAARRGIVGTNLDESEKKPIYKCDYLEVIVNCKNWIPNSRSKK